MIEDEKAALNAGTSRGGRENGCWQAPKVPHTNFTTATRREQGKIEKLLPRSEKNVISTAALVWLAGAKTSRSFQGGIEVERQAAALILLATHAPIPPSGPRCSEADRRAAENGGIECG